MEQHLQSRDDQIEGDTEHFHWKEIMDTHIAFITETMQSMEKIGCSFSVKCIEIKRLQQLNQLLSEGFHDGDDELEAEIYRSKSEGFQMQLLRGQWNILSQATEFLSKCKEYKELLDKDLDFAQRTEKAKKSHIEITLDTSPFQEGYEYLLEVTWQAREFLKLLKNICQPLKVIMSHLVYKKVDFDEIPDLIDGFADLIKKVVQKIFLVVCQPCQIFGRFSQTIYKGDVEVQLLTGPKLGLEIFPPSVSVCVVGQDTGRQIQANGLSQEEYGNMEGISDVAPYTARLNFCEVTKTSTAIVRDVSMGDFCTATYGRTETTLDEEVFLLFWLEFHVGDILFQILKLCQPIKFITAETNDLPSIKNVIADEEQNVSNNAESQFTAVKLLNCTPPIDSMQRLSLDHTNPQDNLVSCANHTGGDTQTMEISE